MLIRIMEAGELIGVMIYRGGILMNNDDFYELTNLHRRA